MEIGFKKLVFAIFGIIILIVGITSAGSLVENNPADKILIIQSLWNGKLYVYNTPGPKPQFFGKPTYYSKAREFSFSAKSDQGGKADQSIPCRFNDKGKGKISGIARYTLPLNDADMKQIHTKYGSDDSVYRKLIRPTIENSIYMTGPLMSLMESSSSKRALIKTYIEDQARYGIYKTKSREEKTVDPITEQSMTVTKVEIITNTGTEAGISLRSEKSPLQTYNVTLEYVSLNEIKYDEAVEKKIQDQQMAIMSVDIAIAEAKKAKQRAITEEEEGKARAAKSKWNEEEIKARAVVQAEQRYEVAVLNNKTAQQKKEATIKSAEADYETRQLAMKADNALGIRVKAYTDVMVAFAENLPKQKLVPEVYIAGSGDGRGSNSMQLIDMLNAKVARDLALDFSFSPKSQK